MARLAPSPSRPSNDLSGQGNLQVGHTTCALPSAQSRDPAPLSGDRRSTLAADDPLSLYGRPIPPRVPNRA